MIRTKRTTIRPIEKTDEPDLFESPQIQVLGVKEVQPRMSMITLGVKNLKKSIEFYSDLGFSRRGSQDDVAFFDLNGTWLGLYGREALAEDAQVKPEGNGFNSFTISHNVSSEEEAERIINHAVSIGATLIKEPQKVSWGGYSGYFADPDGHLWEIAVNPFTWIGPEEVVSS